MKNKPAHLAFVILLILSVAICYNIRPAGAVTWVEGHLTSDTTWVSTDTYRVMGDTYVDSAVTLTIMPGVRVEFVDGFSLKIEGSLNASGTPTEPIIFTSTRTQPTLGIWASIEFRANTTEHLTLKNCKIEYAENAIIINSQAEGIIINNLFTNNSESGIHIHGNSNTTIRGNTINFNKNGITSDGVTVSNLQIVSNTISQNRGEGMYIQASGTNYSRLSEITVANNVVTNNTLNGINLYSLAKSDAPYDYECYAYIENVTVSENIVTSNGQDGINVDAEGQCRQYYENVKKGYAFINNITLTNNTVSTNGGNGMYVHSRGYGFYGESQGSIQNTLVFSNNGMANGNNGLEICSEGVTDGSHASGGNGLIDNITITHNDFSWNGQDGIQLCSKGQADVMSTSSMRTTKITQNEASSNRGNGISLLANSKGIHGGDASINVTTISRNKALLNKQNGFLIQPQTREQGVVKNIQFQENEACLNGQSGITFAPICRRFLIENVEIEKTITILNAENGIIFYHIPVYLPSFPYPPHYEGYVENVTLNSCVSSCNGEKGFSIEPDPTYYNSDPTYNRYSNGALEEITASNNTIVGNGVGVFICPPVPSIQGQTINMTYNAIRNNQLGIEISDEHNCTVQYNDIFENTHGMNATVRATVGAEDNYWGDESGPYHYSFNPNGKGNSVNGNGVNLHFIPFLTSPVTAVDIPPNALLLLSNNTVYRDEIVTVDASNSTGRNGIGFIYFDFGDGTHTNWTTEFTTTHEYASAGTFSVTLGVMDRHGLVSRTSSLILVQTETIPEIPTSFLLPFLVLAPTLVAALLKRKRMD